MNIPSVVFWITMFFSAFSYLVSAIIIRYLCIEWKKIVIEQEVYKEKIAEGKWLMSLFTRQQSVAAGVASVVIYTFDAPFTLAISILCSILAIYHLHQYFELKS